VVTPPDESSWPWSGGPGRASRRRAAWSAPPDDCPPVGGRACTLAPTG